MCSMGQQQLTAVATILQHIGPPDSAMIGSCLCAECLHVLVSKKKLGRKASVSQTTNDQDKQSARDCTTR